MGDELSFFKVTTKMTKRDGVSINIIRIIEKKSEAEARDHVKALIEGIIQESVKMTENDKNISMAQRSKEIEYITKSFQITDIRRTNEKKTKMYFE